MHCRMFSRIPDLTAQGAGDTHHFDPSVMNKTVSCCCLVTRSCLTLGDPMGGGPQSSSLHGILQARTLEWVAISFSRGSSWPRDQTWVPCILKSPKKPKTVSRTCYISLGVGVRGSRNHLMVENYCSRKMMINPWVIIISPFLLVAMNKSLQVIVP